jgi:hypothetical protein
MPEIRMTMSKIPVRRMTLIKMTHSRITFSTMLLNQMTQIIITQHNDIQRNISQSNFIYTKRHFAERR